jgi:hypothetical protein
MKPRHFTRLYSDFEIDECRRRLIESIDEKHFAIFSPSGYKGSKPVIGWLEGYKFLLQKRRYWNNAFAPQFHGNLLPEGKGSQIEGSFDTPRIAKIFIRIWLVGAILIGAPIFILSLLDLIHRHRYVEGDLWVGLVVPPAVVLFGIFLPKFGLLLGSREEEYILEFLRTTLVARTLAVRSTDQTGVLSGP